MITSIIGMGDTHFKPKKGHYEAAIDFVNWVVAQPFNKEGNTLLHFGDITDGATLTGDIAYIMIDLLVKRLKMNIVIIHGNHTFSRKKGSVLKPLKNFSDKVTIIDKPQEMVIDGINFLFLPFYYDNYFKELPPMKEYYANLPPEIADKKYDWICGHYADEKQTEFMGGIDTSYLHGKRMNGHIHKEDDINIGSALITRGDEKGKKCYLRSLTKDSYSKILIPPFLDYYSFKYGDKLPEVPAMHPIWDVNNAPSKNRVKEMYPEIITRRINYAKKKEEEAIKLSSETKSIPNHFKDFCNYKDVNPNVKKLISSIL